MRGGIWAGMFFGAGVACLAPGTLLAASKAKPQITVEAVKHAIESKTGSVQLVTFPDTGWSAVRIVRGSAAMHDKGGQKPAPEKAETAEIVTFADPRRSPVKVLRGDSERGSVVPGQARPAAMTMQVVTFANFRDRPVSILRGSGFQSTAETELFGPASAADLDRVAFAVDGAESSHGADLRMWRPEPTGPQGPMQVTAAAAFDVGGGDRFDLTENRALGRAYLARMYRRYGNWPDAVAAYNWGPGNLDAWIGARRAPNKLPLTVERYRNHVLREAALAGPAFITATPARGASSEPPLPPITPQAAAAAEAIAAGVQRGATAANSALHQFATALRSRAADWKSAYAGLAGRVGAVVAEKRSPQPDASSEYAGSPEGGD